MQLENSSNIYHNLYLFFIRSMKYLLVWSTKGGTMTSEAHGRTLLQEISEKKRIENDDIIVLGAVIHQLFPENSTILNAFNKLENERNDKPGTRPKSTPSDDEFR